MTTASRPWTAALPALAVVAGLSALVGCGEAPEREPAGGARDAGGAAAASSEPGRVDLAITIDDLPWVGPLPADWDRAEGTARILAALDAHEAPATGFVNCGRVDSAAPVLRRWMAAGHALGNHTAEHMDLNRADPAAWAEDASSCDAFLRRLTAEARLPFRYPYLHRGHTIERYRAGREALRSIEAVIAPVTIDTGDWIIDDAYVAAVRAGDSTRAETIAGAYLDHVVRAARHYRDVGRERMGRDVPHILLLHANALLAARLDDLLARLEDEGFRFIPLEDALRDPLYALEDDYIGPEGLSWLYRIHPATPEARAWDDAEADALRQLTR